MASRKKSVIKPEHLLCRVLGSHQYRRFWPDVNLIPEGAYTHLGWQCVHCGMIRIDGLDRRGDIFSRRYLPPEGYRMKRDEIPPRNELRLRFIKEG